jgi:hypothetical protein
MEQQPIQLPSIPIEVIEQFLITKLSLKDIIMYARLVNKDWAKAVKNILNSEFIIKKIYQMNQQDLNEVVDFYIEQYDLHQPKRKTYQTTPNVIAELKDSLPLITLTRLIKLIILHITKEQRQHYITIYQNTENVAEKDGYDQFINFIIKQNEEDNKLVRKLIGLNMTEFRKTMKQPQRRYIIQELKDKLHELITHNQNTNMVTNNQLEEIYVVPLKEIPKLQKKLDLLNQERISTNGSPHSSIGSRNLHDSDRNFFKNYQAYELPIEYMNINNSE